LEVAYRSSKSPLHRWGGGDIVGCLFEAIGRCAINRVKRLYITLRSNITTGR
jgi:hypothetical protein